MEQAIQKPKIIIEEIAPGKYQAQSHYNNEQTSKILLMMAETFIRQSERIRALNEQGNKIIDPVTGMPTINNNGKMN